MKIPLTLHISYLPEWGASHGLRELFQNWLDAKDVFGGGDVAYSKRSEKLSLKNPTASIDRDALLLGSSTKTGDVSQRGEFGEGLKLGTMALVRDGFGVNIYTNTEIWRAEIGEHPSFPGIDVLVFNIRKRPRKADVGVVVEVTGVSHELYEDVRQMFLSLRPDTVAQPCGYEGEILVDEYERGNIYVKGIFVKSHDQLRYGYNFTTMQTDRNRALIDDFNIRWSAGAIVDGAMKSGALKVDDVLDLIMDGTFEAQSLGSRLGADRKKKIANRFKERYNAQYAVSDPAQATELEHLGLAAVSVSSSAAELLSCELGSPATAIREMKQTAKVIYTELGLTSDEMAELQWAKEQVFAVMPSAEQMTLRVVDFHDSRVRGMYRSGTIELSRDILCDRYEVLATLIHEVCHLFGGDGFKLHDEAMTMMWTSVVKQIDNG